MSYSRQSWCHVLDPAEVNDEMITPNGYIGYPEADFQSYPSAAIEDPTCWLHGWNFVTMLYRTLELAMDRFKLQTMNTPRRIITPPASPGGQKEFQKTLTKVIDLFRALPATLQGFNIQPDSRGVDAVKFNFQTANILATLQLTKMVYHAIDPISTADDKCGIAKDILVRFEGLCMVFPRRITFPLSYHLAAVAVILASVIKDPVSENSYLSYLGAREILYVLILVCSTL